MAEAGRRVADLERQLEQLKSYRDEYVRGSTEGRGAMDAVKLQNYRSFLDRLGDALRQHSKNLDAARAEYERRRARSGAKSASRRNRWAASWSAFAGKSGARRTGASSARAMMPPCELH